MKIGILATHPVQYHVQVYRYLAAQAPGRVHVFFGSRTGYAPLVDHGFGQAVQWDLPVLDGYESTFLPDDQADPGPGLHYFPGFWRAFDKERCDLLFIWNTYASRAFPRYLLEARARHVPVLFRADTYRNPAAGWVTNAVKQAYLRLMLRMVDHVLAIGTWSIEFYRWLGYPADRITLAPYVIDNARFLEASATLEPERGALRRRLGVSPETVVFNLTGKYQEAKRPLDLLRAAALCRDAPIHLLLVGEGEMRSMLEDAVRRLGLANVTLTGFVNQSAIVAYYVLSDIGVVTSVYNPWITAVNEAMCCGLPLLLSDGIGAAVDLLREGVNGYRYPMANVDELAKSVRRFVDIGREHRRLMGMRSREIIRGWGIAEFADGLWRAVDRIERSSSIKRSVSAGDVSRVR